MTDSAQSRVRDALAAIAARNPDLAIVTATDAARARKAAQASDQRHAAKQTLGPLDGLILGVKDNLGVAGMAWTAGLGARRDTIATSDAAVVARLGSVGAIPLAMLNMHEGALGATTNNPHFGRTANPLDPDRTPGGSSGGSAAAIAAGFADITLGTDTMGSVRLPAAYCGVAGLKPTRGLIPRTGMVFLSPTLDTIGPLAQDVKTLAAMCEDMAGFDPGDIASAPLPPGWHATPDDALPQGLTIGIPTQIGGVDCEDSVLEGLTLARRTLERSGAQVVDIDLRGWEPARARRGGLLVCESEGAKALADILDRPGTDLMSDTLRALLAYGRDLLPERLADGYARIQAAATAAEHGLADVDMLLMPTAPQRAFRHTDPVPANQADLTSLANFHGGPAVAVPLPGDGLPNSVQIVGPKYSEALVLTVGLALEQAFPMGDATA